MKKILNLFCIRNACLLILIFSITACVNNVDKREPDLADVNAKSYSIKSFADGYHPYNLNYAVPFSWVTPVDEDSIPVFMWKDKPYYHPVYVSLYGIYYLESYRLSGNDRYLKIAEMTAAKLVQKSEERNEDFFFPYNFDYHLINETMNAPWYSGMAQGRMLTFFVRLYEITNEEKYLKWAEKTFHSFTLLQKGSGNWVSYIDSSNYFWVEEYPTRDPLHVLNGFIYAIYGIHDYYMLTNDPEALHLLNATITTVENHINEYRNPGAISSYDIKYGRQKENYHFTHINQMNELYKITGEPTFKEMADAFKKDYYNDEWEE